MKLPVFFVVVIGLSVLPVFAQTNITTNDFFAATGASNSSTLAPQSSAPLIVSGIQVAITVLGFFFVVLQFKRAIAETTKTHDWNRRMASQQACYNFMQGFMQEHWNRIYESICEKQKAWAELDAPQKTSLREILYYLENLGIAMKNNILDEDIIWDYFGSIWPLCYKCAEKFVAQSRSLRNDPQVYENFEEVALAFQKRYEAVAEQKRQVGKIPGKPKIKG